MPQRHPLSAVFATGSLFLVPLLVACSGSDNSKGGGALNCPGVDGTYYHELTGTGDCASLGTTLDTQGAPVADHGVAVGTVTGCNRTVSYAGCSFTTNYECKDGSSIVDERTFVVGAPNTVTGKQTVTNALGASCVFEIYGSTDLAAVQARAGSDATATSATSSTGTNVSGLTTHATPSPKDEATVHTECRAMAEAEFAACTNTSADVAFQTDECIHDWKLNDAVGCGAAWRAYAKCRTTATLNCDTGEATGCSVYQNAHFACQSSFVADTGCTPMGSPASVCAGGLGTYSYGCLDANAAPPFSDCTAASVEGTAVKYYCCS